jgi:hypothetical protein
MKKILPIICITLLLTSCADQLKRQAYLKDRFHKCKVEPATGLIQKDGYQFIVIDTSFQIIAVSFYPGSESKILELRNIR